VAAEPVRAEPDEVEAASPATVDEAGAPASAGTAPEEAAAFSADETRASAEEPEGARAEEPAAVSATAREAAALETPEEATAPEPEQEEPAASGQEGAGGYEDEPQEQPFERDGRWWFRRGDELLVYDEQTGQWMPAPTSRAVTLGSDDGDVAGGTGSSASAPGDEQPSGRSGEWTSQETSGGFWKCPSCGAVNGSTATSCRMCFTPRPEGARSP
jgi:hypothetical protein